MSRARNPFGARVLRPGAASCPTAVPWGIRLSANGSSATHSARVASSPRLARGRNPSRRARAQFFPVALMAAGLSLSVADAPLLAAPALGAAPKPDGKFPQTPRLLFSGADIERRLSDPEDPLARLKGSVPFRSQLDGLLRMTEKDLDARNAEQCATAGILDKLSIGCVTGDARCAEKAAWIIGALIRKNFPHWNMGSEKGQRLGMLGPGELLSSLAIAMDCCGGALTPARRIELNRGIEAFAFEYDAMTAKAYHRHEPWNQSSIILGGLGLASLMLADEPGTDAKRHREIVADARKGVIRNLDSNFDADGAPWEGSMYALYGQGSLLPLVIALKRLTGEDLFAGSHAAGSLDWFPYERVPRSPTEIFYINDSGRSLPSGGRTFGCMGAWAHPSSPFVRMLHGMSPDPHQDPYLALFLPKMAEGTPSLDGSLPLCRLFSGRQIAYFRTGFDDPDATASAFEVRGQIPFGHHQFDLNNFVISGLKRNFFADSGYADYSKPKPEWGEIQARSHNTVLIDGRAVDTPLRTQRKWRATGDLAGYAAVDRGFAAASGCVTTYWKDVRWTRHFAMAPRDKAPYFVCADLLAGGDGKPHRFTWVWQGGDGLGFTWADNRARIRDPAGQGPALEATFASPSGPFEFSAAEYKYPTEAGKTHPQLFATPKAASPAGIFLSVLDLQGEGVPPLEIEPVQVKGGVGVRVATGAWEDWIVFATEGQALRVPAASITTDAGFAMLRLEKGADDGPAPQRPRMLLCVGGTKFQLKGKTLFAAEGGPACFSAAAESGCVWSQKASGVSCAWPLGRCDWNQKKGKVSRGGSGAKCSPPPRER